MQGLLPPDRRFEGTLTIYAVTMADAGQLVLREVIHGIATQRTGAKTRVLCQPFTAPAVPVDAVRTTEVVLLRMAPIALAPVPLDIEAVSDESLLLPMLLN